ncbi:MAG: hypothetical protein LLF78_05325 [Synergistaceae bacterium]|nr:hypothetical protein [Synergistaceae bacterium]
MALRKAVTLQWGLLFLCIILGTWLGIFLQRFAIIAPVFVNFADFAIDVRQIDIVILKFGFNFALKLNLGTLIGGIIGIWGLR